MVGTTVADYEKRKNPYIEKWSSKVNPNNVNVANFNPLKVQTLSSSTSQKPGSGGITALGNTGGANAPGGTYDPNKGILQTEPFQPMYSGIKSYNKNPLAYGRMDAINQITDLANAEMSLKVQAHNNRMRARNAAMQSQSSGTFWGQPENNNTGAPGGSFFQGGENSGLDPEQLTYARTIANIGRQRGISDKGIQIALMTALTESGLRNLNYGDRDSVGLFQQRTSQGWGSIQQIMDPNYSANKFYDTLARTNYNAMNPWAAAQAVQRSFDPTGSNFQRQWALAQRAYQSLNSGGTKVQPQSVLGNSQVANFITQNNNKYIDYDGAYGAQCVDLYNLYTAKFVGGKNYMVGWAPEIFNNYDRTSYTRAAASTVGGMGYVAVFNRGGATPFGHVAIVVGDNGNGTLRVLHANATPQGSRGNTIISNISKASLMGYLIPNKLLGR